MAELPPRKERDMSTNSRNKARSSEFILAFAKPVAWLSLAVMGLMLVGVACSDTSTAKRTSTPPLATAPPTPAGVDQRATLSGTLTLDGQPLEARFLGAHVMRDGLVTACQAAIPSVAAGQYEIPIMSDAEGRGCGVAGGRIVLWTNVGDQYLYTAETLAWPGSGADATFDATFSTAAPAGASEPLTGFKGHVVRPNGARLGGGTVLEAFIGDALCGVTSVRCDAESWFTLLVAGSQVPGCAEDGAISFRVNGAPAGGAAVNVLGGEASGSTIEVTFDGN
jgi:hypothetical protein